MSRPGFVLEMDDKTPSLLTMAGADLRLQRLGLGTKVVYPADAVPSTDPVGLVDAALAAPIGAEPLATQLKPETRLTIVVVDSDLPLPRPEFEVRRTLVERVLETAARAGVDDVELVIGDVIDRVHHDGEFIRRGGLDVGCFEFQAERGERS